MAKTYSNPRFMRVVNRIFSVFIRLGMVPADIYLLSVRGRTTGKVYQTPVALVEENGERWLISPYGEMSWVKNARAAGEVTLAKGGWQQTAPIEEVAPDASAPILRTYIKQNPIVRPYFDVTLDSPLAAFAAEAPRHPVFKVGAAT